MQVSIPIERLARAQSRSFRGGLDELSMQSGEEESPPSQGGTQPQKQHLLGDLDIPDKAKGLVIFAHGSGSSRLSPRNRSVAAYLREQGLATLLFDLLTREEEEVDDVTRELRFDIPFLAKRLITATEFIKQDLPIGYFGASTGAAAALVAAAALPKKVRAVVSRGGRPDLAKKALANVLAPTLLIVGSLDRIVIDLNQEALDKLHCPKKLQIIEGATHLFEESGTLEQVAEAARDWFIAHLH